jgi:hypothetical protein
MRTQEEIKADIRKEMRELGYEESTILDDMDVIDVMHLPYDGRMGYYKAIMKLMVNTEYKRFILENIDMDDKTKSKIENYGNN